MIRGGGLCWVFLGKKSCSAKSDKKQVTQLEGL